MNNLEFTLIFNQILIYHHATLDMMVKYRKISHIDNY